MQLNWLRGYCIARLLYFFYS